MSDAPGSWVGDWPRGRSGSNRPRARSTLGSLGDPALSLPVGPGESTDYQQVLIGRPPALTEEQIESLLVREFRAAKIYDDRLQIARAQAFRLYNGEPLGDEEPGRAQIVLSEVRDTITAMMPTLVRTFAGSESPVEFVPTAEQFEAEARQAQAYVQHVAFTQNDGWRAVHDAILDAMQLKVGWIKWWWDYAKDIRTEFYFSLLPQQLAALLAQSGVEALRVVRRFARPEERAGVLASPEASMAGITPGTPILLYDAQITRGAAKNRPRLMAVPSEQVLIDVDASGPQDPCLRFLAHWRIVTVSDLVALGFPRELVQSRITQLQQQQNRVTRRRDRLGAIIPRPNSDDPAMRRVRYMEAWMRFDNDGDGIAELHKVHAIGDYGFLMLGYEPAAHVPLARICPFMVSHRAIGESVADRVADIQQAMTRVFRNIVDSMSESIHPRTVIQDGMVTLDDVLNTEMGAVIRERTQGAVRELSKPFIGPQAIPILEVLQQIKEQRTGVTRTSQGLSPDVLQSTTAMAVGAQIAASADRLEFVVRTCAEGIKDLYDGLVHMLCEHQDRPRVVLIGQKWVPIDPRAWIAAFHVTVRVGVGHATLQQRVAVLSQVATQQMALIDKYGPNNPLCSLDQLRNTLADLLVASGVVNVGRYWNELPAHYQFPTPPPAPNPDLIEAQNDSARVLLEKAKIETERWTQLLDDDRLRDESRAKMILQALEIAAKSGATLDVPALAGLLDRNPASPVTQALMAPVAPAPPGVASTPGGGPPAAPGVPSSGVVGAPGAVGGGAGGLAKPLNLPTSLLKLLQARIAQAQPPPPLVGPGVPVFPAAAPNYGPAP